MSNGTTIADSQRVSRINMANRSVLYITALPDFDNVIIRTQYRAKPNTRFPLYADTADENCGRSNPILVVLVILQPEAIEREDRHCQLLQLIFASRGSHEVLPNLAGGGRAHATLSDPTAKITLNTD